MRTHITFDLLRGILVACIASNAAYFLPIRFPWSVVDTEHKVWFVLAIAVYSFLLWAVLLRPASTTKIVFGVLLAIAVLSLVSALWVAAPQDHNTSLLRPLRFLSGPLLTAIIALLCHLKLKSNQTA